ncbi:MAG: hypothetical protein B7Y48_01900 [Methylophilales bacterium 28-44-11]|nr:MAG: hypothetical protein B7Y48_01900 [Methylophilales bacterium 28-44-11]
MHEISNRLAINKASMKMAVVSFDSLGDSLLYLLLAENLKNNGYDTTYFGNVGHQLRAWLPKLKIAPHPPLDEMQQVLSDFQLVIMSPTKAMRERFLSAPGYLEEMRCQYLLICQHAPDNWHYDRNTRLRNLLTPEIFNSIKFITNAGNSIRYKSFKRESAVDILCSYMRERMNLSTIDRNVHIQPLANLEFRKNKRRVIVSPDSAGPDEKNWGENQFLTLCKKLRHYGFDPVIVVAPQNYEYWKNRSKNQYSIPVFDDLSSLASFIYESSILIANDSGNGHLASFLGIPTITIYKKANPYFHWRPDWTKHTNVVLFPKFIVKLPWFRLWKPFLTVRTVLSAAINLVEKNSTIHDRVSSPFLR